MKTFERIYNIVAKIPKGKVVTYKQIARLANTTPRTVGFALHANKNPNKIPCHRVVFSSGKLSNGYAFGGINAQRKKLTDEGVKTINKDFVNLNISEFDFD